jgi:peroxiredoxin
VALAYSNGLALGTSAPDFSLPATDGETYTLASFAEAEALVIVFTCNHCPYAQAVETRLVELQADYAKRNVRLCAINPNDATKYPDDSMPAMAARISTVSVSSSTR